MNILPHVIQFARIAEAAAKEGDTQTIAVDAGWTPTSYLILSAIILGTIAIITAYIKAKPILERIKREGDQSLRQDLLARISALEKGAIESSKNHAELIATIKQEHHDEIIRVRNDMMEQHRACEDENRSLRAQMDGLHRQMIMWQLTSGQAVPLHISPQARDAVDKIVKSMDLSSPEKLSIIADALEANNAKNHD